MDPKNPTNRQKARVSGTGTVQRQGRASGSGPRGSSTGYSGRTGGSSNMTKAAAGGGGGLVVIIVIIILLLRGGGGSVVTNTDYNTGNNYQQSTSANPGGGSGDIDFSGNSDGYSGSNSGGTVNTNVAPGSRDKRTVIKGNGSDVITLMVYLCGTDLESRSGMATNDLTEMASATLSDNVNVIVYTGGCTNWRTRGISNSVNQIYKIEKGGMKSLVPDDGAKCMTDPETLSGFIKYAAKEFPADRYELIMWDHGGGSVSGYGYDEKNKSKGSMTLSGINKALKAGGVTFDFIGFDACLMATAETALMLEPYADYMIASEETEPGIGWYYTNWLNNLSKDTSMSTLDIGKNIIDDYTATCAAKCPGQKTTLSLIDLAEFSNTIPSKLNDFSDSISGMINDQQYKTVSDARYSTREFATSSKIDQVDLANLAENMRSSEGRELSTAIKSAVKYCRNSSNMTNANGVSIYFPYKRVSYVDKAVSNYEEIGMDDSYANCIKAFASLETSGQVAAGGTDNPLASLLGGGSSQGTGSSDMISSLLGSFLSNRSVGIDELDGSNTSYMDETSENVDDTVDYISMNHFDTTGLTWQQDADGTYYMLLSDNQWDMLHEIDMQMFYDDGSGYVDLGWDNLYGVGDNNALLADTEGTWLSIGGHVCAYYHTDTIEGSDEGTIIRGRIPAELNGERVNLIVTFSGADPYGKLVGAVPDYINGETDTIGKAITEIEDGDEIKLVCDYYSYDGEYDASYYLDTFKYSSDMVIGDIDLEKSTMKITYRFTDIYNQEYWTESIVMQ